MKQADTLEKRLQAAAQRWGAVAPGPLAQPPYTPDFAQELAYRFSCIPPADVPGALAGYFPNPDAVDCAYLAMVLLQIEQARSCERGVGCGVELVFYSFEYSARHMASARQWLAAAVAASAAP